MSVFLPIASEILNISQNQFGFVTTVKPHQLIDGLIVRLDVPPQFGMYQINQMLAAITIQNASQFYISINTTLFEPFVYNVLSTQFIAQVVPVGEISSIIKGATQNVLPTGQFSN